MSPLLSVEDLTVHFAVRRGFGKKSADVVHAADEVSLAIEPGQTLALVGESGSGKTTVARAILQLTKPTAGRVVFQGKDIGSLERAEKRSAMSDAQVVFQDPYSSLSPRLTVHDVVAEPLRAQSRLSGKELSERIVSLLEMVGLGTQHLWRRPHEFSGGQCQRIAIARALALEPRLVVLDEPTSALDVSVQARILVLLDDLQKRLGLAYLFIAHDLAVVESIADTVAVMYLGQIVESGPTEAVLHDPRHPYTRALLASVPSPDPRLRSALGIIAGEVPSAVRPPSGCRFHPRCPFVMEVCPAEQPPLRERGGGRRVACHLADDFTFAPIARPRRDDGTSADPPAAADGRSDPQGPAEADPPLGRSAKEALFGTRRRVRLVPGAMVDESRDGGGGSR
jgi:oligopeptide/dipeptide ABC transporter ATP-binding protein